jgi:hypothetical protein
VAALAATLAHPQYLTSASAGATLSPRDPCPGACRERPLLGGERECRGHVVGRLQVTQSGRGSKKHGALQQRVVDSRIGANETLAITGSRRLDAGELDHLGPLLGVVGDKFFELNRRAGKHRAA